MKKDNLRNKKHKLTVLCLLSLAIDLSGCKSTTPNMDEGNVPTAVETSDSDREPSGTAEASGMDAADEYWYTAFLNAYKPKLRDNRIAISECRSKYQSDAENAKNTEYKRMDLSECEFKDFPDCSKVYMMTSGDTDDISVDEGIRIAKEWLKQIGAEDFDLEKNLFDPSGDLEKEGDEYPLVYEHLDELKRGTFFSINTKDYHLQIGGHGIYTMSDGTLNRYVGGEGKAAGDAFGFNSEEVILEGRVEDLKDEGYELLDGYLTIGEGAEVAKNYFINNTPNITADVDVEAVYVHVFQAKDKYGYRFFMRKVYKGVPVAWWFSGQFQTYNFNDTNEDSNNAHVVTKDTVSAYEWDFPGQAYKEHLAEDKIIALPDMLAIAEEQLARNLDFEVHSISFQYFGMGWENELSRGETFTMPCWRIWGINKVNNEYVRMYVDALTGDVYIVTSRYKNSVE